MIFDPKNGIQLVTGYGANAKVITERDYQELITGELGNMMFETATIEELESTYLYGAVEHNQMTMLLEAISTTRIRLDKTMNALARQIDSSLGGDIAVKPFEKGIGRFGVQVGRPLSTGVFPTITARIGLSDGQSIGVVFHAPSAEGRKMASSDNITAFRFMLNSRDITHVIAPQGAKDLTLKSSSLSIANLAQRNSSSFKAKLGETNAQRDKLKDAQDLAEKLEAEIPELEKVVTKGRSEVDNLQSQQSELESDIAAEKEKQDSLRSDLENARKKAPAPVVELPTEEIPTDNVVQGDFVNDDIKQKALSMSLAEFQRWAMGAKNMTAKVAEDLYNDTIKQRRQEVSATWENKPENVASEQLFNALKATLGSMVTLDKGEMFSIKVDNGLNPYRIYAPYFNATDSTMDYQLDSIGSSNTGDLYGGIKSGEDGQLDKTDLAKEVARIVKHVNDNSSKLVDLSDLPSYGTDTKGGETTKELAKIIRQTISKGMKSGALPKGIKTSVTSDYNSIDVTIKELPDSVKLYDDSYWSDLEDRENDFGFTALKYAPEAKAIKQWIDAQVEQYHWDESDLMTDYHHSRFYYTQGASFSHELKRDRQESEQGAFKAKQKADLETLADQLNEVTPPTIEPAKEVLTMGDSFVFGDVTFVVNSIAPDYVHVLSHGGQESAMVRKDEPIANKFTFKGFNDVTEADEQAAEKAMLKEAFQNLDLTPFVEEDEGFPKGYMTYVGQDAIYDALRVHNEFSDMTETMKIAQRVRDEHNMGKVNFFDNYGNQPNPFNATAEPEPEPEQTAVKDWESYFSQEEVESINIAKSSGLDFKFSPVGEDGFPVMERGNTGYALEGEDEDKFAFLSVVSDWNTGGSEEHRAEIEMDMLQKFIKGKRAPKFMKIEKNNINSATRDKGESVYIDIENPLEEVSEYTSFTISVNDNDQFEVARYGQVDNIVNVVKDWAGAVKIIKSRLPDVVKQAYADSDIVPNDPFRSDEFNEFLSQFPKPEPTPEQTAVKDWETYFSQGEIQEIAKAKAGGLSFEFNPNGDDDEPAIVVDGVNYSLMEDDGIEQIMYDVNEWNDNAEQRVFDADADILRKFIKGARKPKGWDIDTRAMNEQEYGGAPSNITVGTNATEITNEAFYTIQMRNGKVNVGILDSNDFTIPNGVVEKWGDAVKAMKAHDLEYLSGFGDAVPNEPETWWSDGAVKLFNEYQAKHNPVVEPTLEDNAQKIGDFLTGYKQPDGWELDVSYPNEHNLGSNASDSSLIITSPKDKIEDGFGMALVVNDANPEHFDVRNEDGVFYTGNVTHSKFNEIALEKYQNELNKNGFIVEEPTQTTGELDAHLAGLKSVISGQEKDIDTAQANLEKAVAYLMENDIYAEHEAEAEDAMAKLIELIEAD